MAQSVARILGKDEVTGSNPVSSSTVPKTLCFRDFFYFLRLPSAAAGCPLPAVRWRRTTEPK